MCDTDFPNCTCFVSMPLPIQLLHLFCFRRPFCFSLVLYGALLPACLHRTFVLVHITVHKLYPANFLVVGFDNVPRSQKVKKVVSYRGKTVDVGYKYRKYHIFSPFLYIVYHRPKNSALKVILQFVCLISDGNHGIQTIIPIAW
jgi:hypothetical protein